MGHDQRRMISGSSVGSDGLVSVPAWLYYTFDFQDDNLYEPDAKAAELGTLGAISAYNDSGFFSSGTKKWGAGCVAPNGDIFWKNMLPSDILSGDRTIEFWAYVSTAGSGEYNPFVHLTSDYASTNGDHVGFSSGDIYFNNGNTANIEYGFPINQWVHVACVIRGPATLLWLNQDLVASNFQKTLGSASVSLLVGGYGLDGEPYQPGVGDYFIDDLRITKAALYWPGGSVPDLTGPHGATAKYKPAPFSTEPQGSLLGGYWAGSSLCDFYEAFSDGLGGYYEELVAPESC